LSRSALAILSAPTANQLNIIASTASTAALAIEFKVAWAASR
jgi:hypothetical protein